MTDATISTPKATLAAACLQLKDPEEYVRRMLQNLSGFPSNTFVDFLLVGEGVPPHYFIRGEVDEATGIAPCVGSFNGKTHRALPADKAGKADHQPSTRLTKKDVSDLLGEVRKFRKPSWSSKM
jgi:hypothetical protein